MAGTCNDGIVRCISLGYARFIPIPDDEKGKISLGLKQLQADPWSEAEDTYEVGQVLKGKVTRVTEFGAFIELEPGIEALAHVSTFPPRGKRDAWREAVPSGAMVAVEVLSFDLERKRIGVAVVEEGNVSSTARPARVSIEPGVRVIGKVERHEQYGIFVFLAPGRTGLVPLSETGVEREGDLRKTFPVGNDLEVMVLDVEEGGRRIRLSCKAVHEADQNREARNYAKKQDDRQTEGFGSLADKLKAAMKPSEK